MRTLAFVLALALAATCQAVEFPVRWFPTGVTTGDIDGYIPKPNATNPTYQIDLQPGSCIDDTQSAAFTLASTVTIDITASGANGLDAGSETTSTWYYIWAIHNPTTSTTSGLLSTSTTSPSMPSGYVYKRRVGSVRNRSTSDFLHFMVIGNGRYRQVYYNTQYASTTVLSGGTASSYTDVDCSAFVPPTSRRVTFLYFLTTTAGATTQTYALVREKNRLVGLLQHQDIVGYPLSTGFYATGYLPMSLDVNQVVEYWATPAGATFSLYVRMYWEAL